MARPPQLHVGRAARPPPPAGPLIRRAAPSDPAARVCSLLQRRLALGTALIVRRPGQRARHGAVEHQHAHPGRQRHRLDLERAAVDQQAWPATPQATASWSMMPLCTPTISFSTRWPRRASAVRSIGQPANVISATATPSSSEADEESPEPSGRSPSISRSAPGMGIRSRAAAPRRRARSASTPAHRAGADRRHAALVLAVHAWGDGAQHAIVPASNGNLRAHGRALPERPSRHYSRCARQSG